MIEESPYYDVGCALPDLRYVAYMALGAVVIAAALALWTARKLRPW